MPSVMRGLFAGNALVALGYVAAGLVGLRLAMPPGFAADIWLPSGIALAAFLLYGRGIAPGVLMGALVLNATYTIHEGWSLPVPGRMGFALLMAAASTLQALVVAHMVRRREGDPPALDTVASVLRFALLWCPAGCLIGAGTAVVTLFAGGQLQPAQLAGNLFTWWFGDWIGMVIVAPALLAIAGLRSPAWRGRCAPVALSGLLSLCLVAALYLLSARQERERLHAGFETEASELGLAAVRELEGVRRAAGYLRDLFAASESVSRQEFRVFADGLISRQGVLAAGWAPRVPEVRLAPLQHAMSVAGFPEFRLKMPLHAVPRVERAGVLPDSYPLIYAEPLASDLLLGLDLSRAPGAEAVFARARDVQEVIAMPPVLGRIGAPDEPIVVLVAAVGPNQLDSSGEVFDGVITVALQPGPLLERLLGSRADGQMRLALIDMTDPEQPLPIFEHALEGAPLRGARPGYQRRFEIGSRIWEFSAEPGQAYLEAHAGLTPAVVQRSGLVGSAMLVCFMLVLSGRGSRVEQLVGARTAELDASNRQLRNEMAERAVAEERLGEAQRNFLDSLAFAQIGSWDFDVGAGVVSGTREVNQIYGLAGESFRMDIATVTSLVHTGDRERFAEAMRTGLESDTEIVLDYRIVRRDGEQRWVTSRSRRKFDARGAAHVLGVIWDVSDRIAAAARMKLLASAFERGGEAIFIADSDLGVLEVNLALCDLTGLEPAEVIGREAHSLFGQRTTREQFRGFVAVARERGHWQGEIWGRRADGTACAQWLVLAAVRNERGIVTNYIGSFVDISDRKRAEEKIEFLAHHDALTGLPNRFALQSRLEQAIAQAGRDEGRIALMFIDMDRFKDINDSLGHDVGDLLLLDIARRLRACVRASDIVARLGGDEFVVALTGLAGDEVAAHMAEKLRLDLSAPYAIRGRMLHSSPSIGISLFPAHGDSVEELMRNADAAMYRAKDQGRNNFQFFDISLSERARERLELAADLRLALEREEFLLHFQPQVRAEDGRFVAAEALIRWRHPVRGMVPPDRFIGIAEEFGLIDGIGEWALHAACRALAGLTARGIRDFRVCVNLSPRQLRDRELPLKVAAAIAGAGVNPRDLELELTESVAMQDPQFTIALLNRLFDSGVGLAIDDFGTGYSSLSYLKMLPLHNLKLDRSFVRDIETDASDRAICSATVALAHALGIKVVAEGVENAAQRDFLLALGCDYLQGWLFSKALPVEQLAELLQASPAQR